MEEIRAPKDAPRPGYYRHYKNDVYYLINVEVHTETGEFFASYIPLHHSSVYIAGKFGDARPLHCKEIRTWWQWILFFWKKRKYCGFLDPVIVNGREEQRYTLITDPVVIPELDKIRNEMYGE